MMAREATIYVKHDGVPLLLMRPQRRNFPLQQQTTSDVAISTNLLRDLYVVLGEEHDGTAILAAACEYSGAVDLAGRD